MNCLIRGSFLAADGPFRGSALCKAATGRQCVGARLYVQRGFTAALFVAGGVLLIRRMQGAGGRGAGPGGHLPAATGPSSGPTTNAADQAEAAAMRVGGGGGAAGGGAAASSVLDSLAPVRIDTDATQKYVLIEATDAESSSKFLVRGSQWADYHKDAARETIIELDELGVRYEVLGGGRIKHDSEAKTIEIYGFSYGFPWADEPRHDLSAEVIKVAFPDFEVTTSNAGY